MPLLGVNAVVLSIEEAQALVRAFRPTGLDDSKKLHIEHPDAWDAIQKLWDVLHEHERLWSQGDD